MAESTLKSLLFELVTFLFNNLDCVVHDNDESTEVMMTKTMMVIILNLKKKIEKKKLQKN